MPETLDRSRTPLLTLITAEALDRDYQVAAAKRESASSGSGAAAAVHPAWRRHAGVAVVVGLFAMLVTVAAVQTSRDSDEVNASRASLIERIETRRDAVGGLQEDVADLRAANTEAEQTLRSLGRSLSDAQTRLASVGALAGFEPVRGDGVRIVVDNPPGIAEGNVLRDSDLALLADALWSAGAEAVAINGQRLTAMSAIRNSGDAIEVNSVGIAPPYTVVAIGDQSSLAANMLDTPSGQAFRAITGRWGYSYDVDNVDDVRLPAARSSMLTLRSAARQETPKGGEEAP